MKLILCTLFLMSSQAMACLGGRLELDGDVLLTADNIQVGSSSTSSAQLLKLKKEISWGVSGTLYTVSVIEVKQDPGGLIHTIYKLEESGSSSTRIIKIKSNYEGNGVRMRGMDAPTPVDETYGC